MTSILVTGALTEENRYAPDGTPWRYSLNTSEGIVLADTCGDVIAHLMPEYGEIGEGPEGDVEALLYRAQQAIEAAGHAQSTLAAEESDAGTWSPQESDDRTLTAILSDRRFPVEDIGRWDHPVPLVLIATDYAPYCDRPAPTGNIHWIDPHDELLFLLSLARVGLIEFYVYGTDPEAGLSGAQEPSAQETSRAGAGAGDELDELFD